MQGFGWSSAGLPAPVARSVFNPGLWKCFGTILALLAAATLSLNVADVVLTLRAYCTPWSEENQCSTTEEPYVWVWVASGIWGSIPILLAGLFAIYLSANPAVWTRCFSFFIFQSALVFAPGIMVLTCIAAWRGGCSDYGSFFYFNKNGSVLLPGTIPGPYVAKYTIPFIVVSFAGIMFVMTAVVTWVLCCNPSNIGLSTAARHESVQVVSVPTVVKQQVPETGGYYLEPPQPQINKQSSPYESATVYSGFPPNQGMAPRFNNGVMYGNFASRENFKPTSWS